ncbi:MAG: hypothetical protein IJ094_04715 [Bacilli bacterium]|nr:hypothetical protein [Bacilli bacterium]
MENEEIKIEENLEESAVLETEEVQATSMVVANVNELSGKRASNTRVFTTLDLEEDKKKIFNLESNCDYKINDCK